MVLAPDRLSGELYIGIRLVNRAPGDDIRERVRRCLQRKPFFFVTSERRADSSVARPTAEVLGAVFSAIKFAVMNL